MDESINTKFCFVQKHSHIFMYMRQRYGFQEEAKNQPRKTMQNTKNNEKIVDEENVR